MFLLTYIVRLTEDRALWRRPSKGEIVISSLMTLVFGVVMGHTWFAPDTGASSRRDEEQHGRS